MAQDLPLEHAGLAARPYEAIPDAALEGSVGDRLAQMVRRFGDRTAIRDGAIQLSYAELGALCRRIAAAVSAVEAPGPVAVLCRHDHRFVAAVLGVMGGGRPCVPLDADHPLDRNARIARHAGAAAVVSTAALAQEARALLGAEVPVIDMDVMGDSAGDAPHAQAPGPGPEDIAYILYTSGSTGQPKGVFQDHRGLIHEAQKVVDAFHADPEDRQALFYSPASIAGLDVSLTALLTGGSLEVMRPGELGAKGLAGEVQRSGSTVLCASPTLFRHIVQALEAGERLDGLRMVVLGGERVGWGDFDVFSRGCRPDALLGVHMGSTECWTLHSRWFVQEAVRPGSPRLPVGFTIADRRVMLVDGAGAPVADGQAGEVVVSSRYLARGYWREPELTAQAFGDDPLEAGARTYRTGDLARRRPDGLLEFEGRKDEQIKLHGYRIEPGEIEGALRACPGVRDAAVVVRRDSSGAPRALAAYVEAGADGKGLRPRHLMAMLRQRVPRHMTPAAVAVLPKLPWLANFKIDRQALEALDARRAAKAAETADPVTAEVAALFEEVLGVKGAHPDDNLQSLGGDSLQAINLGFRLEERFGIKFGPGGFDPTLPISHVARQAGRRGPLRRPATMSDVAPATAADTADRIAESRARGIPLPAKARSPLVWGAALHIILSRGELELGEWTAGQLSKALPGTQLFANMSRLLKLLPATDGLTPFQEDPRAHVQVVPRKGARATLLHFFGGGDVGAGLPLTLLHRWFGLLDANLVYLRPFNENYFLGGLPPFGPGAAAMGQGLRRLLEELGAARTLCYGNSMGGFAAIRFGLELGADAILGIGPQTIVGPDFDRESGQDRRRRLAREFPGAPLDVRPLWQASRRHPRLVTVYGDGNWDDRLQSERMAGLPNVELRPLADFDGHFLISELIRRGAYLPLLRALTGEVPSEQVPTPAAHAAV